MESEEVVMKNNIVKMVMVVVIFVVIGSALNSMTASLITQSKNDKYAIPKFFF